MTLTTALRPPVDLTLRRLVSLLAAVAAASAAVTWTVTTTAIDNSDQPARATTSARRDFAIDSPLGQPIAPVADAAETAGAAQIVVADAYHGTGLVVCAHGEQPLAVVDAYHGVGTTVCP